jgi:hypothetical protein
VHPFLFIMATITLGRYLWERYTTAKVASVYDP